MLLCAQQPAPAVGCLVDLVCLSVCRRGSVDLAGSGWVGASLPLLLVQERQMLCLLMLQVRWAGGLHVVVVVVVMQG